ncbi:acyl-CoA dehydrogenase family protein [Micromonospora sp. NPDC051196]|uniref:acyl-CoA dehydrogenase family protein n=1 Tax=Micromonospora sp. NPDC051196 TaxID=3155281 RepID=UPI0034490FA5
MGEDATSYLSAELREVLRCCARDSHADGTVGQDSLKALRSSGLLAICVPTEHGGRGYDVATANRVVEEVATVNPSVAIMLYLHCAVVTRIDAYGTEEQKRRWFDRITDGGWLAASAWSEAGGHADKRSLGTVARRWPDGSWRVTGGKTFSTSSTVADFFMVLAQLPEQESSGTTATAGYGRDNQLILLITADADGVRAPSDALPMIGMRGSGTGLIYFEDTKVDAGDLLCEGAVTPQAIGLPHRLGLTLGAVSVGTAQAALDLLLEHQHRRGLLDEAQARHQVARLAVTTRAARAMVADLGAQAPYADADAAYAVKVFASTSALSVCTEVRTLLGSAGYLQHHDIARVSLDAEAVIHMGPPNHLCVDLISRSLSGGR